MNRTRSSSRSSARVSAGRAAPLCRAGRAGQAGAPQLPAQHHSPPRPAPPSQRGGAALHNLDSLARPWGRARVRCAVLRGPGCCCVPFAQLGSLVATAASSQDGVRRGAAAAGAELSSAVVAQCEQQERAWQGGRGRGSHTTPSHATQSHIWAPASGHCESTRCCGAVTNKALAQAGPLSNSRLGKQ